MPSPYVASRDDVADALAGDTAAAAPAVTAVAAGDMANPTPIDVMVVWTPAAEAKAGCAAFFKPKTTSGRRPRAAVCAR